MFKLALKNISRNKRRTFLSALTIFIATIAVIAFLSMENGMINDMRDNAINHTAGNINIKSKLYEEHKRVMPLQFYIPSTSEKIEKLMNIEGVKSVSRKSNIPVSIWMGDRNENAMANAIDFSNSNYFDLSQTDYFEGVLPEKGSKDVLITRKLAYLLDLKIGDKFTFLSKTATGGSNAISTIVSSIISFNDSDLNSDTFFISPETLSPTLRMDDGALELLVYTDSNVTVSDVENALDDDTLIIQDWSDVSFVGFILDFAAVFYGYIKIIFFVMASTVIINTTMMSVIERRREAATLMALGYKQRWVRNLFLLESAIISLMAAVLGAIVGAIIINTIGKAGLNMANIGGSAVKGYGFNNYLYFSLPFSQYLSTILYAVLIAIIACIIPTRKILKLQIANALHDEI
jgi:putative ABC transport system permease protein